MKDDSGDLNTFGYRQIEDAKRILDAFAHKNYTKMLGDDVTLHFNPHSAIVYLSDEDYNSAVLTDDGVLEDWFVCSECGREGFKDTLLDEGLNCCKQMLIDLVIITEEELGELEEEE